MINDTSMNVAGASSTPGWERALIEKLALEALKEQRLRRRWGIFFKLSFLVMLLAGVYLFTDLGGSEMENLAAHKR